MATYTPNFNLSKPEDTDTQSSFITDYRSNMDTIDANLGGGGGGGGSVFLNTIYTDTEKKIGYWRDNKPLYACTFDIGSTTVSYNSWTVTSIPKGNMETIVYTNSVNQNGKAFWGDVMTSLEVDSTYVALQCGRNSATEIMRYVTLFYTKTTDTPEPNPQVGNVIYLPTIYSDEERQVGVWRDSKPLYQITIDIAPLPNRTTKEIQLDADIERVISMRGYGIDSNDKWDVFFNDVVPTNITGSIRVFFNTTTKKLYINTGENLTSYTEAYVTLQYTKTTDSAGSGNWNTDGIPMHHYSTNEQVVGTWVDGKPLYQRTWDFGSNITVNSNVWTNTTISVAGNSIKAIINSKATNDGGTNYNFIACNTDQTYIQVLQTRNTAIVIRYLTLEYTKSTD